MSDQRWLPPTPTVEPLFEAPASGAELAAGDPHPGGGHPVPAGLGPVEEERPSLLRRLTAPLIALIALAAKLKGALLVVFKAKFLISSGSMLVSVVAYGSIWGWQFGVGFVLLLLVHEYGHVIALKREGIEASAPIFIPFMGALIWSKSLGEDAAAEARVGLAGPLLGSVGALACVGLYALTGNHLFQALAFTGFFLNLFNLLPVGFLDGARATAAMSPWVWLLGVFLMAVLILTVPNPFLIVIGLLGIYTTYHRFREFREGGDEVKAYYRIAKRDRIAITVTYLGLIVALAVAMDLTHLERTLG